MKYTPNIFLPVSTSAHPPQTYPQQNIYYVNWVGREIEKNYSYMQFILYLLGY